MSGKKIPLRQLRHYWPLYLFVLPTVILIGMFQYYPASSGIFHSFFRWNGADISEWVGLYNYSDLLGNMKFWQSFELAFALGVWNIVKMIPALLVAICIHRCTSGKMQFFYRVCFAAQMVIPGLVVVLIWRSFFFEATGGFLNRILISSGIFSILEWLDVWLGWGGVFIDGRMPAWLGDPKLIVAACIIWGFPWVGSFAVLNYLARLQSIPKDIYEAAAMDGVSWWTKFTRIEFPLIMASIKLLVVLVIIDTLKDAGMILALAGMEGGPGGNATVPALFMLRKAFIDQDMGYACAIGVVLTLIVLGLQKVNNIIGAWMEMSARQKFLTRISALALAGLLLFMGRFFAVSLILLAFAFPYGMILHLLRSMVSGVLHIAGLGRSPKAYVPAQDFEFKITTGTQIGGWLLRIGKHLVIWGILFFAFFPLYLMVIVSFKTNEQFYVSPSTLTMPMMWENWITAYEAITPCLANSLLLSISTTVLSLSLGLSSAYFFARYKMPLSSFLWNAILIMMMMPAIANMMPLFRLLMDLDLLNTLRALIIVGASSGQIFAVFVLRSFVEDIPHDLFEAAEMDGAGHFQQMRIIVLPLAGPALGTVGVMNFVSQWNDFVLPLIVIRDQANLPVMVQLLRMAGEYIKLWGPLMAGYALASIPVVLLFVFTMKLFVKGMTEGAVKG